GAGPVPLALPLELLGLAAQGTGAGRVLGLGGQDEWGHPDHHDRDTQPPEAPRGSQGKPPSRAGTIHGTDGANLTEYKQPTWSSQPDFAGSPKVFVFAAPLFLPAIDDPAAACLTLRQSCPGSRQRSADPATPI